MSENPMPDFNRATSHMDAGAIVQIMDYLERALAKKVDLKSILNSYITQLDSDIAATDTATQAVVAARAATNADNTVNANLKAELRALEDAVLKLRTETRNYKTAFVWIRDNYTKL